MPPDHFPNMCKERSAHLWELTRLFTSHNNMWMAAPSLTPPLSVSYTPSSPNLLHKQLCLISSGPSIPELREPFNDFIFENCPWRNCLWDSGHFCPHYSSRCVSGVLYVCSVLPRLPLRGATALKRPPFFPASLPPLMCHGQARLLCSHFRSLSFSPSSPPPFSLGGFFSLLDGAEAEPQTNFSHSRNEAWQAQFVSLWGNRIYSSVPQKTPFFQSERELFVWWQLQLSSCSSCDSFKSKSAAAVRAAFWEMMLCTLQASRVIMCGSVCNNQILHRVPFNKASECFQVIWVKHTERLD